MANDKRQAIIGNDVDTVCAEFLKAHKDIEKIEYRFQGSTHSAYIKLTTAFGKSLYYDVTDLDCGQICVMLCVIISGASVVTRIKDIEAIREVERLFK